MCARARVRVRICVFVLFVCFVCLFVVIFVVLFVVVFFVFFVVVFLSRIRFHHMYFIWLSTSSSVDRALTSSVYVMRSNNISGLII